MVRYGRKLTCEQKLVLVLKSSVTTTRLQNLCFLLRNTCIYPVLLSIASFLFPKTGLLWQCSGSNVKLHFTVPHRSPLVPPSSFQLSRVRHATILLQVSGFTSIKCYSTLILAHHLTCDGNPSSRRLHLRITASYCFRVCRRGFTT